MNMKTIKLIWMLLCIVALSSCKQNNWLDWRTQNELWLENNKQAQGVITTPTGLQYKCIFAGPSNSAKPDDAKTVTIKYSGQLINGFEFDASEAYMGNVTEFIKGFSEGLKKMHEFSIYEFYVPYQLGYGKDGIGTEGTSSHIPPYSTLIFHVELISIN